RTAQPESDQQQSAVAVLTEETTSGTPTSPTESDTATLAVPTTPAADLDEVAASADLVRVYLNEIGKVALLTAADEVELSKRIEAGLYAQHLLGATGKLAAA